jgi:hypothetical protein
MGDELKSRVLGKTGYIFPRAGGKIVHANDFMALRKKAFA